MYMPPGECHRNAKAMDFACLCICWCIVLMMNAEIGLTANRKATRNAERLSVAGSSCSCPWRGRVWLVTPVPCISSNPLTCLVELSWVICPVPKSDTTFVSEARPAASGTCCPEASVYIPAGTWEFSHTSEVAHMHLWIVQITPTYLITYSAMCLSVF